MQDLLTFDIANAVVKKKFILNLVRWPKESALWGLRLIIIQRSAALLYNYGDLVAARVLLRFAIIIDSDWSKILFLLR